MQEEATYKILHLLRYPLAAIGIASVAVISVVVSLTGPDDPADTVEAFSEYLQTTEDIQITTNADAPVNQQQTQTSSIDLQEATSQYRKTLRVETLIGNSYIPNFVPQGNLVSSITSFTPANPKPVNNAPSTPDSSQPIQPPPVENTNPPTNFIPAVEQWRSTVTTAIINYGGAASDTNRFLRIMQCESMGQPDVTNSSSGAAGLMQHMPQYWDQRAISAGFAGSSPYDPLANINVSAWLIYQASGGGWQHWVCQ